MSEPDVDDFSAFADAEDIFHGLLPEAVFRLIRRETEAGLRRQVSDSVLNRIETFGTPKGLTIARTIGDSSRATVAHFAFCVRARLFVCYAAGTRREVIEAALTFFFGNVDRDTVAIRAHFDLHRDAELNFSDDRFLSRVLAFRAGLG